ncbi:MAG: glycosyltransferase family 8 protein [Alphaproteobacteria bacterium]|nr:glycosyltransferase family 8 protein [Alphaproteobacteria bacterium]
MSDMNIVFAVNDEYASKLGVTIVSILENNKDEKFNFFVLSSDFSDNSKQSIDKIKQKYQNWNIKYIVPDNTLFESLKLNIEYISVETYYRYVIANVLPEQSKALYLDADLVVNGSLTDLYNLNLKNRYCAGVKDLHIEKTGYKSQIGFSDTDLYINAGVLLLNLSAIRKDSMVEKLFDNTKKLADKILYQDQDIINITFKNKIKETDSVYNFAASNVKCEKNKRKSAVIIHYTGKRKPWNQACKNKMRKVWFKYNNIYQKIVGENFLINLLKKMFFRG